MNRSSSRAGLLGTIWFGTGGTLAIAALLVAAGCAPASDDLGLASDELRRGPTPVFFDGDMGFDDTAALAYLCEEHHLGRIELVGVTVTNNGVGFPGSALRHARCVLDACGLPDVPVADGSPVGENEVAIELRGAMEVVLEGTFASCTASVEPAAVSAPELLHDTLLHARRPVTLVVMGPLTNVDAALELDRRGRSIATRIERLYMMGGAIDVPGNLFNAAEFDNTQETNVWVDPAAAQDVFDTLRPWTVWMVPLDATNDVPITTAYVQRIASDHTTPSADVVNSILSQPIMQFGVSLGGFYWWDPLTAVSATRNSHVTDFERARISIVQSGPSAGRTVDDCRGAHVYTAVGAVQSRFENAFLDGLNGREP